MQGKSAKLQIMGPATQTDETAAPWSVHAPVVRPACCEALPMLEAVVPASLVPEVERMLHVSNCTSFPTPAVC